MDGWLHHHSSSTFSSRIGVAVMLQVLVVGMVLITPVMGTSPFWSSSSLSASVETLWEVWSTRIVVALVVVMIFEYWQKPKNQQTNNTTNGPPSQSRPTTLTYVPMAPSATATPTVTAPFSTVVNPTSSHPLLERLEQQQQELQQVQVPATSSDDIATTTFSSSRVLDHDDVVPPKATTKDASTRSKTSSSSSSTSSHTLTRNHHQEPTLRSHHRTSSSSTQSNPPPPMTATSNRHPGMDAFCHWYDVQTSLYRIYTLGRHDGVEVAPPYIPHSYRGQTTVNLHVTNQTSTILKVYWVDYKGRHILKGTIKPNQVWHQSTWIDHPWVFEGIDDSSSSSSSGSGSGNPTPYLYYIPYRVIPTLKESPTTYDDDHTAGLHKFAIIPPTNYSNSTKYYCGVRDEIMPFSAWDHFSTPVQGFHWTLQFMSRLGMAWDDPIIDLVQKYLANIVRAPEVIHYRQLRTRSTGTFGSIWNSPLQGLFLAVGFVEVQGFVELGCAGEALSRERIQDVALLSYMLTSWKEAEQKREWMEQPVGAMDGYGRAGYGRVGM